MREVTGPEEEWGKLAVYNDMKDKEATFNEK